MSKYSPSPAHEDFIRQFVRYQPRIHAFIATLAPNAADAEEILQETSIVAWQKYDQFTPGTDFVRWVCTIARYETYRFRRQHPHQSFLSDELLDDLADRQLEQNDVEPRLWALSACLKKLRPDDHELFRLRYAEQTTAKLVAEELNRPANTVYKALGRIRRSLLACIRRRLAEEEGRE